MSLINYEISLSGLSPEERSEIMDRIDRISWTGFKIMPGLQAGQFDLNDWEDPAVLNLPAQCHLRRVP